MKVQLVGNSDRFVKKEIERFQENYHFIIWI